MPRRIGCIFAHPDDETFCVGGIVAKYAAEGIPIDLYCATNGDAGKSASVPVSSRAELAAVRRNELGAAMRILGIGSVELPGHPDGALSDVDANQLVGEIVAFIRRTKPVVLLTLGPEGAPTGHRDHSAISRAATAAFFLSGLATSHADDGLSPHRAHRLYYHAWEFPMPDPKLKLESVPATALIDVSDFKEAKARAFEAHVSQRGSSHAFYSSALVDVERLALAAGIAQPAPVIDDVFAGLPR